MPSSTPQGPRRPPTFEGRVTRVSRALELLGYFYGVGALILVLAAFATGRLGLTRPAPEPVAAPDEAPDEAPQEQRRFRVRQPQEPHTA
jgi:hypothetical protein